MKSKTRSGRNLLHNHPLLRKGGQHGPSAKAQRRKQRMALNKKLRWPSVSATAQVRLPMASENFSGCGQPGMAPTP